MKKLHKVLMISMIVYVMMGLVTLAEPSLKKNIIKQQDLIKVKGVPIIGQFPTLPTGCEATALTMLLNYNGVSVTKEQVVHKMTKVDVPYYKNGKRYGYHPSQGFIGNPYSESSYGVYAPVIVKMIEDYLPGQVEDLTGKSLNEVLQNIDEGRPVMIWATIGMSNVRYKSSWIIDSKGTVFKWPGGEHAVVITGYDKKHIIINDPYTGKEKKYKRSLVEQRFNQLGKQAVSILEPIPVENKTPKKVEIPKPLPVVTELEFTINGENYTIGKEYTVIQKEDEVLVPLKYLPYMVKEIEVKYENSKVQITGTRGIDIELPINEKQVIVMTPDAKNTQLDYEIEKGVARANLNWFMSFFDLNCTLEGKKLNIVTQGF